MEHLLTTDGAPRRGGMGVFTWRYFHDEKGHVTEEAAFDVADRPLLNNEGWHRHQKAYGPLGCIESEKHLGLDGKLVAPSGGVAEFRITCDRWGNEETRRHFDPEGRSVQSKSGEWGVRWSRDEHGKVLTRSLLDEAGRPAKDAKK